MGDREVSPLFGTERGYFLYFSTPDSCRCSERTFLAVNRIITAKGTELDLSIVDDLILLRSAFAFSKP